ncbi:MAG TPA: hypothetical protein VNA04_12990 [Thermoanaerobaculia bacterium]|nr:hypothetical protein [Thermoanaerobaculia bacterium]
MWTARRIMKELADPGLRRRILIAFWRHAEPSSKLLVTAQLAQALHFRDATLRKLPVEKKADLLASRIGDPDFDQFLEIALMQYHTHEKNAMMAAFLDRWGIQHQNGSIEAEDYPRPTPEQVRAAAGELEPQYDRKDIALYLAAAGLLMDEGWRAAVWPVVDEIAAS